MQMHTLHIPFSTFYMILLFSDPRDDVSLSSSHHFLPPSTFQMEAFIEAHTLVLGVLLTTFFSKWYFLLELPLHRVGCSTPMPGGPSAESHRPACPLSYARDPLLCPGHSHLDVPISLPIKHEFICFFPFSFGFSLWLPYFCLWYLLENTTICTFSKF